MRRRRTVGSVIVLAMALLAAACASTSVDGAGEGGPSSAPLGGRGWIDGPPPADGGGEHEALAAVADAEGVAAPPSTALPLTDDDTDTTLNAGSIDDNELWDEYLLYRQDFDRLGIPVSHIDVEGRQIVEVVDGEGRPIVGATVEVRDQAGAVVETLRTYADGRTLFHAPAGIDPDSQSRPRYEVVVTKGEVAASAALDPDQTTHRVVLDGAANGPLALDVLFLIDATGSMSDEIERLKANMTSVAEQVAELPGDPHVRFAMTVYRDRGDSYVTKTFDFTDDVGSFTGALAEVVADGGGDTPESLGAALQEALTVPAWREGDAVKLVFLVADAPPHLPGDPGYADEPDYADGVRAAARAGVKILPIASSGLDAQGEYVFRQLAQVTMGRLVFLTYGADGSSPGTSTPLDIDPEDYDVLSLDALVVQLVRDELEPLQR